MELVAVSSGEVEDHRKVAEEVGAEFPILSDTPGDAIRAFGVLHPKALPLTEKPIARPAVFLLDGDQRIRQRWLTENWRVRLRGDEIVRAVEDLRRR